MSTPVPNGEPPASWRTDRVRQRGSFEGADHGGPVSGFVVDAALGEGQGLHRQTFVVLAGRARLRRGDEEIEAGAGSLVVVPAGAPHRFESLGPERLQLVAIHAPERMTTEWL